MLIYSDNQWFNGNDIEFISISEAKANRIQVVENCAASIRGLIVADTSPAEMSSWALKLNEARAGGGDMLALEAQYRGISESSLIDKILINAQQLAMAEAMIAGVSGKHSDAINALTSVEEVCAYDMRSGWPEF